MEWINEERVAVPLRVSLQLQGACAAECKRGAAKGQKKERKVMTTKFSPIQEELLTLLTEDSNIVACCI